MFRVGEQILKLVRTPGVVLQVLLVLRIDGSQPPVKDAGEEQGLNEELGKAVDGIA